MNNKKRGIDIEIVSEREEGLSIMVNEHWRRKKRRQKRKEGV